MVNRVKTDCYGAWLVLRADSCSIAGRIGDSKRYEKIMHSSQIIPANEKGVSQDFMLLRPHHFMCMLTFAGYGYSEEFKNFFTMLMTRMNAVEIIFVQIAKGKDEICNHLDENHRNFHCRHDEPANMDLKALADLNAFFQQPNFRPAIRDGSSIDFGTVLRLHRSMLLDFRTAYTENTVRAACQNCNWKTVCDSIVRESYARAVFQPRP